MPSKKHFPVFLLFAAIFFCDTVFLYAVTVSREIKNVNFEAVPAFRSREIKNVNFEAVSAFRSREVKNIDFEAVPQGGGTAGHEGRAKTKDSPKKLE